MKKVPEVLLKMENAEQILLIDRACQKCAELLIINFSEKGDEEDFSRDVFEFKERSINDLEQAFAKSVFSYGKCVHAGRIFSEIMHPIQAYNDVTVMRILYPVLFYTLILKNFLNEETVNRRLRRGSKSWGKTKDLLDAPSVGEQCRTKLEDDGVPEHKDFAELKRRIDHIGEERIQPVKLMDGLISEMVQLAIHGNVAVYFLEEGRTNWMEAVAQRGLFARWILESQTAYCSPIDSLLQMYLLESIDRIVSSAAKLSDCEKIPDLPESYLLTAFCEDDVELDENESCGRAARKRRVPLVSEDEISDDLDYLYSQLSQLTFTGDDISRILDCFFDEKKLEWYQDTRAHVYQYAEAIVNGLDRGENIDERHFDLENLFAPYRMKLFED